MGPSGAGKTCLLDVLSGRKSVGDVSGSLLVNGQPVDLRAMKHLSGYVYQEDVMLPTLTVRETLLFAVKLRSSAGSQRRRRALQVVEELLGELSLTKVADTRVGGELMRGISGGERRRLSVGLELITEPRILFVDEPTSGLDSNAALLLMNQLRGMAARKNSIVICTIHQPRSSIFNQFHRLLVLAEGRRLFFGAVPQVTAWLSDSGHECPEGWNPADAILDLAASPGTLRPFCGLDGETGALAAHSSVNSAGFRLESLRGKSSGFVYQLQLLMHRQCLHMLRDPIVFSGQAVMYILTAVFTGLLFSSLKQNVIQQLTLGLFFGGYCAA